MATKNNNLEYWPILLLNRSPEQIDYTSPQSFPSNWSIPPRDPVTHSEALLDKFKVVQQKGEDRQANAVAGRHGMYIEFASSPGHDLPLKSLENRQSGIRLLNVRTHGDRAFATVYVPKKSSGFFVKRFQSYRDEVTKSGRPKNENLVASIDNIRLALLNGFWTDNKDMMPKEKPEFVEVWLSTSHEDEIEAFREVLTASGLEEHPRGSVLKFPERTVLLACGNRENLIQLIDSSDQIAELRASREPSSFFLELENADQVEWVEELLARSQFNDEGQISICLLDSGVNEGHPLLTPILSVDDLHAVDATWGTFDHKGHGTMMAGVLGYGDLHGALETSAPILVSHRLESVKILPPPPGKNREELWGDVILQGIALAEIQNPSRKRIICLAVTCKETGAEGRPTSWSATIDQSTSGVDDGIKRLFLVSAGNVSESADWLSYPDSNLTNAIHDPAQSWNALTVGAYTNKIRIETPGYEGWNPVAPENGLSPFSSTSSTWSHNKWPIKPEVVFEGGNAARTAAGSILDVDDLQPISTARNIQVRQFGPFNMTSASTAFAANFAASIWSEYPELWPETVRGLIVHSAKWTKAMTDSFLKANNKRAYQLLLRTCGYGVPNFDVAVRCLKNRLTLVSESVLHPYEKNNRGDVVTKDLHLYDLPWPKDALLALGEVEVEMRVTLSYFVQPGPGEIGWKERYRYPSHGLRFELNSPGESRDDFLYRINRKARDGSDVGPETPSAAGHWRLGEQRDVGSVHSDIWSGIAADLAASNLLAIYPTIGWWRERDHLRGWENSARYSLIISINSPKEDVDIYTPVATEILMPIEIETQID
ncbi:MAG: S8 family peptidase [Fimbriimonadaceae bacterium]